ncbi:VCBS repeat-containing protein [filamentous cyanobacterium LEGE 11480]|uniref:VCBS repeat-containing protein n=1 Tax=Romeriopsis navalis LEGE 11480 TaxID=2777977 RepID=A0A928Z639_9CYAN|nr:FG-GAP-like repeat-containing protein [Romeriopsis navalis]MBE9032642.1 VCBS repeat-containing protein [Romeriopsis navalis LEGE 11480]
MDPVVFVPAGDVPPNGFYFNDAFTGTDVLQSNWISRTGSTAEAVLTARTDTAKPAGGIAGIGASGNDPAGFGALRLTSAAVDQDAFVLYDQAFASDEGLNVTFDLFAYGGNGADGISFFLLDGSTPGANVQPGALGGALGYSSSVSFGTGGTPAPGLTGAYLGIGFDEFGNFSNPGDSAPGGPGKVEDSVAIRGSAANNYQYLTGTSSLTAAGGIDNLGVTDPANRDQARRMVEIDLTATGILDVSIDLNNDGVFQASERVINDFDVAAANGAAPASYKFGFASSTGGSTNIHEVRNLAIAPSKTSDAGTRGQNINTISFGDAGVGVTYIENATPGTIAQGLTIEGSPASITSATVSIRNNFNAAQDILTIGSDPATTSGAIANTNLNWTYDAASGLLTLSGAGTEAEYQAALRTIAYANNSDAPTTLDRTIRYTLFNNATPITLRDTLVKVNAVDDLPTAVAISSTTVPANQDGAIVGTLQITDPDSAIDAPSYTAFGVTGGSDKFEVVSGGSPGVFQLKLKAGETIAPGESIPQITVNFTDAGAPNGGAVSQTFDLTPTQRKGEIFWRNNRTNDAAFWYLDNTTELVGAQSLIFGQGVGDSRVGTAVRFDSSWQFAGAADFNGDGITDQVYQNGVDILIVTIGELNGQSATVEKAVAPTINGVAGRLFDDWKLVGLADMTGDNQTDLVFRSRQNDAVVVWAMDTNGQVTAQTALTNSANQIQSSGGIASPWEIETFADIDGDGDADIIWRTGDDYAVWEMNNTQFVSGTVTTLAGTSSFEVIGAGQFNNAVGQDVLVRNRATDQTFILSFSNNTPSVTALPASDGGAWDIEAIADMNGDGTDDILWYNPTSDQAAIWTLSNGALSSDTNYIRNFLAGGNQAIIGTGDPAWEIQYANGKPATQQSVV